MVAFVVNAVSTPTTPSITLSATGPSTVTFDISSPSVDAIYGISGYDVITSTGGPGTYFGKNLPPASFPLVIATNVHTFMSVQGVSSGPGAWRSSPSATVSGTPTGGTPVSPNGTTAPPASNIIDATNNVWTIVGGVVQVNGGQAGFSANVTQILWYNGIVYQFNGAQWFPWAGTMWGAGQGDPRVNPGTLSVKVVGNVLKDSNNNTLVLQGVNFAGAEVQSNTGAWSSTTQATWKGLTTNWAVNAIRIPLNETFWNTNAGGTYQSGIITAVNNIIAAGLYPVIDLHWTACTQFGAANGQANLVSQDTGIQFWTSVANTFKNLPAVIFEFHNEPYGNSVGDISGTYQTYLKSGSGNTLIPFVNSAGGHFNNVTTSGTFKAAGHQGCLNAVRSTGATNVCLYSVLVLNSAFSESNAVRPDDSAAPAGFGGVWTSQIAATVHYANGAPVNYAAVLNAGFPIVMTEFYTSGNLSSGGNTGLAYLRANNISYFEWTPAPGPRDAYVSGGLGSIKTDFSGALSLAPWVTQGTNPVQGSSDGTLDNYLTGANGTRKQS